MLTNSVSMIPFALLSGIIHSDENENFVIRIIEVAKDGFHFRIAEELNKISSVTLYFYNEMEQLYKKVDILDPRIQKMEKGDFSVTYEVLIDNKNNQLADEYKDAVSNLFDQYYAYIKLKMDGDDAKLSNACNGYPSELDKVITTDFALQKRRWFKGVSQYDKTELLRRSHIEFALELDNPLMYSNYMENSFIQFVKKYWKEHEASDFWIAKCKISRLYIGNQFCHNLFPDIDNLLKMMSKAKRENVNVTVTFTYLREELIEKTRNIIDQLYCWCKVNKYSAEVVVNDWGMMSLIQEKEDCLTPVLGVLLNKRRKDPRMKYMLKSDKNKKQLESNSVNSDFYQNYLKKEYNISRYEFESCGYRQQIPRGKHSVHIPFYQTNTSQYCTLYARCKEGERGRQKLVTACPYYCRGYVFSYPDHLGMVGKYNSLFGCDTKILEDDHELLEYTEQGIDRIVVNLL